MHFNTRELLTAVTKVKAFVARRSALPILQGIKLTPIGPNAVSLEGTDLEAGIITMVEAEGKPFEPMVVEAKALYDALRQKGNFATCNLDNESLGASASTVKLRQWPADDYPTLPLPTDDDGLVQLQGDIGELLNAIPRVAIAASGDQARPILCGVAVEYDEGRNAIDLVTTDTYRLAVYRSMVNAFVGKTIWPAKAVTTIAKTLGTSAVIHVGDRHSYFASIRMLCFVRNIEGPFPKWRSLWPPESSQVWEWTMNGPDEHQKMVTVAKMSDRMPIVFDFAAGTETMNNSGEGIGFNGRMSGKVTDGDLRLALNPSYLADSIRIAGQMGGEVTLRAVDALKPVTFTGDPGWEVLQMPVRI